MDEKNLNEEEFLNDADFDDVEELYDDYLDYDDNTNSKFGKLEHNNAKDSSGHYDKNYYVNRQKELDEKVKEANSERNKNYKMNEGHENEVIKSDGYNTSFKNSWDKVKDQANYANAKRNQINNKIAMAKDKAYKTMHPTEMLKEKVNEEKDALKEKTKQKTKDVAKKAGKAVGKAIVKGAATLFHGLVALLSNPVGLAAVGILLIILLILLLFAGTKSNNDSGYFDNACNFNETIVTVKSCSNDEIIDNALNIKDYVIKATAAYTSEMNFTEEQIKAIMIIIKTNALSNGNYNNNSKMINIDDCDIKYLNEIDESEQDDLSDIYESIENYLYISESYTKTISNLGNYNVLEFNDDIINSILSLENEDFNNILDTIYSSDESNDIIIHNESLFLGDSRTHGMLLSGLINDNNTVYGDGQGYYWLVGGGTFNNTNSESGGIDGINDKIIDNESYNIIIWLGINDLYITPQTYFEKYKELAQGEWQNHNIYIVSIGPVIEEKINTVDNASINEFNDNMEILINESNISNLKYINLNLTENDIEANDGLHYEYNVYSNIYNIIMDNVNISISGKLSLYNLTDYCVYYNLTENDAYWWPIGSNNETSTDIYGGSPASVTITSEYGPRVNVSASNFHSGIDIGASKGTPVIASKDGVVTLADDSGCIDHFDAAGSVCAENGSGYGNYIKIDHGDGIETVYGHLTTGSFEVSTGDKVKQGQIIGRVGSSGSSSGYHLHFEVRINNSSQNPLDYVSTSNPRPTNVVNISGNFGTEGGKQNVCKSLLASGISKDAVIGILINIAHESGNFSTNNLEGCYEENQCCKIGGYDYGFCVHNEIAGFGSDALYTSGVDSGAYPRDKFVSDRAGYGLIQWTSEGRKAGLYDYAKEKGESIASLNVQMGYLFKELQSPSYASTWKYITGNYSAAEIGKQFCILFEAPSNYSVTCSNRVSTSLDTYTEYVNNGCN